MAPFRSTFVAQNRATGSKARAPAPRSSQVKQFTEGFWPSSEIYLDGTDALFAAVGGGEKRCAVLLRPRRLSVIRLRMSPCKRLLSTHPVERACV